MGRVAFRSADEIFLYHNWEKYQEPEEFTQTCSLQDKSDFVNNHANGSRIPVNEKEVIISASDIGLTIYKPSDSRISLILDVTHMALFIHEF